MKAISKLLAAVLCLLSLIPMAPVFAATSAEGYPLIESYQDVVPEGLKRNPQYTKYALPRHYLVMMGAYGNIRTKPSTSGTVLRKMNKSEKLGVLEAVMGQEIKGLETWYKVFWYSGGKKRTGYIHGALVEKRQYDFDRALEQAERYKRSVEAGQTGRIANFRNQAGVAPKYEGTLEEDSFSVQRFQATAAYELPDASSPFRYIQDGRMVNILGEENGFYQVEVPDLEQVFYVPKKFVVQTGTPKVLNQVILVDRKQQNLMTLEWKDGWELVSYTQATTGAKDEFRYPTDLGLFMAIAKKPKFEYLDDETKLIDGYAPYAIRFNGGAFIHGVPVDYKIEKEDIVLKPEVVDKTGKVIKPAVIQTKILSKTDPGMVEYMASIGTVPRSHKCVRNYTSHAKFLYDRIKIGEAAVVVFE